MAKLYQRPGSPFWCLDKRDPKTGERQRGSLELKHFCDENGKLRRDLTEEERTAAKRNRERAETLEAEATLAEREFKPATASERWDSWVPTFLEQRYENSSRSLRVRKTQWKALEAYLEENNVEVPRQLTRQLSLAYIPWRFAKHQVVKSSAMSELKLLSVILREAMDRSMVVNNSACSKLKIQTPKVIKLKPAFTPEMIAHIENVIIGQEKDEVRQKFFRTSHLIAKYHGCRISETYIKPQEQIEVFRRDEAGGIADANITFYCKGGKHHTVKLHPKLFPLFNQMEQDGELETFSSNYGGSDNAEVSAAQAWHNAFENSGARKKWPGICFHCHRVTVATQLARAGVSERQAMRYLGHGSSTVHAVYLRLCPEDLPACTAAVG